MAENIQKKFQPDYYWKIANQTHNEIQSHLYQNIYQRK